MEKSPREDEKVSEAGNDDIESENELGYDKEELQCRFYRREWPEIDEIVSVSKSVIFIFKHSFRLKS